MCGICHFTVIDFDNYNKYLYGTLQILVTRSIKKKKKGSTCPEKVLSMVLSEEQEFLTVETHFKSA